MPGIVITDHRGHPVPVQRRATGTGVGAAGQSPVRVSVTPPDRRENARLTGTPRRDVVLKAIGLAMNSTYVEGALANAADYRGPVTPYPASNDDEWNQEVAEWLEVSLFNPSDHDASGNHSFSDLQRLMWRYYDLEGEIFAVETHEEPGNKSSRPVTRLIPSLMCDSPVEGYASKEWIDGVKIGLHHRAVAYHFLAEETAIGFRAPVYRAGFEVKRKDVFHFARRCDIGGARGVTRFLTSAKDVIDVGMMDSALHRIFDLAAKLNGSLTVDKDGSPAIAKPVSEGIFKTDTAQSEVTDGDEDEPTSLDVTVISESLQKPGPTLVDLTDNPGMKLNFAQLAGHLPNVADVHSAGLERMAMPWGLPVQLLFCVFSGVFNVTGPGFRIGLARGARWRTEELRRITPFALRTYHRHVSWGIETGQIARPKKSLLNPLMCRVRYEPDLTIDEQRNVNNDEKRLQMGITSEKELAHLWGRDWNDVVRERTEFILAVIKSLGEHAKYWGENFKEPRERNEDRSAAPARNEGK